jgi:hypothetical protein
MEAPDIAVNEELQSRRLGPSLGGDVLPAISCQRLSFSFAGP